MKLNLQENQTYLEEVYSILGYLTAEEKKLISQHSVCLSIKKGEMVYEEGETPSGLVCLLRGKVKVFKEGFAGRDWIARLVRPVEMVGYRALFAEEDYNASAQTIENSVVCIIEKNTLFKVLSSNPKLSFRIMKLLAKELGFINERTITLTQKHIRGRLAETLLFLKNTYGFEEDSKTLKVYLSREDLANLSNMTASNAIRTLSAFNAEGLIGLDGRKIKLLNLCLIEKVSRLG